MDEIGGYIFGALTIITTIVTSAVKGAIEARRIREKAISDVAGEKATLKFQCDEMKKIAEEIKGHVKENYRVLSNQLATLESTMLASDKLLGERIDAVAVEVGGLKVTVAGHTEAIGRLKDDVKEIKSYNGKKAG